MVWHKSVCITGSIFYKVNSKPLKLWVSLSKLYFSTNFVLRLSVLVIKWAESSLSLTRTEEYCVCLFFGNTSTTSAGSFLVEFHINNEKKLETFWD